VDERGLTEEVARRKVERVVERLESGDSGDGKILRREQG
jgi:hypothetical protein